MNAYWSCLMNKVGRRTVAAALTPFFAECATHSTHRISLRYLQFLLILLMSYGDQLMDNSVFLLHKQDWYQSTGPVSIDGLVNLDWTRSENLDLGAFFSYAVLFMFKLVPEIFVLFSWSLHARVVLQSLCWHVFVGILINK